MLGCAKRSCDQKRSSSPSPAALHLAEAASALPDLNWCCSARFVASQHHSPPTTPLLSPLPKEASLFFFLFFYRSWLPQAFPDPDKASLTPGGVSPAALSSPSPTQASRCSLAMSLHARVQNLSRRTSRHLEQLFCVSAPLAPSPFKCHQKTLLCLSLSLGRRN